MKSTDSEILVGRVMSAPSSGVFVSLDGGETTLQKPAKKLNGVTYTANTNIIIYKINGVLIAGQRII